MDDIRADVDGMAATHRRQLDEATNRWSADIAFARLGMQLMTAFTVALLLVVWLLARRDAQQREARRRSAVEDKRRLETEVEERTAELSELSSYLQRVREDEKSKLARDIHDELGGILVSAKMDVAWVEERMKKKDPQVVGQARARAAGARRRRADQAQDHRGAAAHAARQPRPVGRASTGRSTRSATAPGSRARIATPSDDSVIAPQVSIALYRILQEALTNIVKYAKAKSVSVDLGLTEDTVTLLIEDDGVGIPDGRAEQPPVARHRRNAPARAGAARRVRDRAPAGRRHDDRGQRSARARARADADTSGTG